jgi:hypothetical protein
MQMDSNEQHFQNAFFSIRVSLESDSNLNAETSEHLAKHSLQRISTDDGREIDVNE